MGRPPLEKKQRQLAVALPPNLRNWLEAAANVAGHSIAEEIRRRLALTVERDGMDAETRALLEAVGWMADEIRRQSGADWHDFPKATEALAAAIHTWLEIIKPKESSTAASDLFSPDDPPTLGRSIARHYQRFKIEREKTDRELRNLSAKGDKS